MTPTHKMAAPHVVKGPAPMWTQDGQQGRAVGRHQAYKGEQLGVINPAGEGN